MNKRDFVLSLLDPNSAPAGIPAGFFLHFDKAYHSGRPAVEKHLEYFRYTGMDFVKIQYEYSFPHLPQIQTPDDWAQMPLYGRPFYQDQLDILAGLLKEIQREALVIMTLYSPFMSAGSTATKELLMEHIQEAPHKVQKGMEIITDSLMVFVKECIKLGIDGFYASTQGGESYRLGGSPLFNQVVMPYDLRLMEEMARACPFNILHVCDYHGSYDDLTPFLNYPGHVVNVNPVLESRTYSSQDLAKMFNRPFMGGLDRHGPLVSGSPEEIRRLVNSVLDEAPERFILGADCTVPSDIDWDHLKIAIDAAHQYQR